MNLFVGNLNPETTVASLRNLFSEFGEIVSAKILMDNMTGMSRGFGFVEMADKYHSFDAIDSLDSIYFEGNIISVKEAKQSNTKPGGGSRDGNRFNSRDRDNNSSRPAFQPRPPRPRTSGSSEFRPRPANDDFNRL